MIEPRGKGDSAARVRRSTSRSTLISALRLYFLFTHSHNIIHVNFYMFPITHADLVDAQAVGDGARCLIG